MKKFTPMLASLLLTAGSAFATPLIADGVYQLNVDLNSQRGQVVAADSYEYPVLDNITLSSYEGNSTTAMENGLYYYVKTTDKGTYFYNVAKDAFIVSENSLVNFGNTPTGYWTISANSSNSGYYNVKDNVTSKYLSGGCGRTAADRPMAFDTNSDDGGALFTFTALDNGTTTYAEDVTAAEAAISTYEASLPVYLTSTSDLSNSKTYAVSTADRGSWVSEDAQLNGTTKLSVTADGTEINQQFAFLRTDNTPEGEYYLYSVGKNKFVSQSGNYTTLTEKPVQTVTFLSSTGSESYPWVIAFVGEESTQYQIGISNGYSPAVITFYNDLSDAGNRVSLVQSNGEFDSTAAVAAITAAESNEVSVVYSFTYNGEQKYTQTTQGYIDSEWPAITVDFPLGVTATLPEGTISSSDVTDGVVNKTIELTIGNLPFQYAEDYSSIEHWYYLNIHTNGYYLYYAESDTYIALNQTSVPSDSRDAYTWAFIGDPFNGYQIVNYAAGEGMILSSTTNTDDSNTGGSTYPIMTATPVADGNNTYWVATASTYRDNGFYLAQADNAANILNNRSSKLAYWTGGADGGSTFVVEERDMNAISAATTDANAAIAAAEQYVIGIGVGEYSAAEGTNIETLIADLQAVVEAASDADAIVAATTALNEAVAALTLNMPQSGKFYRIQCVANSKYLNGTVTSDRIPMLEDANGNMAESVFYYDGTYLVAWQDGKVLGTFASGDSSNSWKTVLTTSEKAANSISFGAVSAIGKYSIQPSSGRYIYGANANADCGSSAANEGYFWTISEVEWLPIVGSEKELTAVYSPVALNLKDNVSAYTATISGTTVPTTKIESEVPANTAVLVKFAEEVDRDTNTGLVYLQLNYDAAAAVALAAEEETTTNALSGSLYAVAAEDGKTYYTTQERESTSTDESGATQTETVVDFCQYEGTEIPGFVTYIAVDTTDETPEYYQITGEGSTTAIEEIEAAGNGNSPTVIYDLQGRRLSAPVKGINIINGKKVLVK